MILVDQSPIGRTPRSNPVTYIKVYDAIREVFASTREAQARGFDPSHFSSTCPAGVAKSARATARLQSRCSFSPTSNWSAKSAKARVSSKQILDVRYRGKNVHEVLNMTVREAITVLSRSDEITNRLRVLDDVGLGYLRLGQSATTLRAAKRNASNSRRICQDERASARSTSSTSRRPVCTSTTSTNCSRRSAR